MKNKYTVNPARRLPWTCPECGFTCKAGWAFNHQMWCDPKKSIDNFWSKVDKTSHPGGCWLYTGCLDKNGYGDLHFRKTHIQAHRLAWKLTKSEPSELDVLHKCNNPQCCNPDHLYLGTDYDNARDRCTTGKQARRFLAPETVRELRKAFASDTAKGCVARIAKQFGIGPGVACQIKLGKKYGYIK